jgi:hypothetical protein
MIFAQVAGLHVGSVETCSPTEIKVLLDVDAPQDIAFNTGRPQGFPRLNGYVLIPNEGGAVVAVISRMTMEPAPLQSRGEAEASRIPLPVSRRRLFVTPLGTLDTTHHADGDGYRLRRGVASYPAVGDGVVLPAPDQLRAIVEASGVDTRVCIGTARLALDAPVTIDPDKLFGRHVGVFGNTGSGKSCTVAGLIRWSVEAAAKVRPAVNARFILLDPNGEYRTCFADLRDRLDVNVYSVEPGVGEERLTVPGWMWNGQEWSGAVGAAPGAQRPVLVQAIRAMRAAALAGDATAAAVGAQAERNLLATQVRAYIDWLSGCRAEGVGVLAQFPRVRQLHENCQGLEDQLQQFSEALSETDADLFAALEAAWEACRGARQRRTDHSGDRDFIRQFQDSDLVEILEALAGVRDLLPEVTIAAGPSEDTPVNFDLDGLPGMVNLVAGLMPGNMQQHMAGLDLRLRTMLADTRVRPLIDPENDQRSLADWLHELFGAGDGGRGRITVLDLSLVPSDVLTTVVSVLGRLVFEAAQRYRRIHRATLPTVIVLEEAHNFVERQIGESDEAGPSIRCRQMFEKIAKEGRKFGVGLMLSSQRPAELSPTIVAQCNSFVLHRIVNDRDQELVNRLAPDSTGSLLKELPSLPTQKAILMGIAAEIPVVFDVRPLAEEHRPSSENPDYWSVWTGARLIDHAFREVATAWTGQSQT